MSMVRVIEEFPVQPSYQYTLQCRARAQAQVIDYTGLDFQLSNANYESVENGDQTITSTTWQPYSATLIATADAAMGVVTFYKRI